MLSSNFIFIQYHRIFFLNNFFSAKSNLPVHGPCWHESLKELKSNCNKLNDQEHSLLALRLANCFLEDSGHITYDCHFSETEADRRWHFYLKNILLLIINKYLPNINDYSITGNASIVCLTELLEFTMNFTLILPTSVFI